MATGANQPQTPDLAPESPVYEDGNLPQNDQAPQSSARTVQEDSADRREPQQWKDDKRSEIFERARERRMQETEPFSGDPNDPDALYGSNTDQSDLGELEQEALRRRQEATSQITGQQPRKPLNGLDPQFLATRAPVIIDGQQHEITVEEALREYQINRAADKRLEQANALLAQTKQFRQTHATPAANDGNDEPTGQDDSTFDQGYDEDRGHTTRRPGNAKELVEKIQLGTPDEAQQALEDFISQAVNRDAPVDDTTRVLTALEDANSKQAILQFAQENPQVNNPVVQMETTREIQRNMALDLMKAGYTIEQLRELAPSEKHLTNLHKQARIQRLNGVRSVPDLMAAGYQGAMNNLRQLVGSPTPQQEQNPAPSMQQRQQRKEALQQQPVARRLSPSLAAPSQQRTQEQSRSAAVSRIRQSRGQPT
jgi:hypothetical protein